MGLGIYEEISGTSGDNQIKVNISGTFSPDFGADDTLQIWNASAEAINIERWIGETLLENSVHEIYINNKSLTEVVITFSQNYILMDEDSDDSITVKLNETAYFYATCVPKDNTKVLILRTGSQDTRKV